MVEMHGTGVSPPSGPTLTNHFSPSLGDPQRGVQEHPELSVGSNADGVEVRSVGNSPVLQETYLIEAFNLKVGGRGEI